MQVKHWMTPDPIVVSPDDSLPDAFRLMKENKIRRLPVVENGRLVGLATYRNLQEVRPSAASTLSIHEALYLIARLKIRDVMRKNPVTVGPDDDALTALLDGRRKGLGCLPVTDQGRLVGIITSTDFFNLAAKLLGAEDRSDHLFIMENSADLQDPGYMPAILSALAPAGLALTHFMVLPWRDADEVSALLLKIAPGPEHRRKAAEILTALGLKVLP